MKIRSWLLLSYLVLIVFTLAVSVVGANGLLAALHQRSDKATDDLAAQINEENSRLAEEVLTHYGEQIVSLKADSLLSEIMLVLRNNNVKPYDYEYTTLRKNTTLRKLVTQSIYTRGEFVGYFDLMDNRGNYVLHPNDKIEGLNYEAHRQQYPQMYDIVRRSFKSASVSGYYDFLDGDVTRSKYMVIKAVPGYQFRLVAAVPIDNYFKPVQQSISAAQDSIIASAKTTYSEEFARFQQKSRNMSGLIALFVLALAMLFGMWFANRITRPVLNLRELFLKMAEGDFTTPAQEKGAEELRSLSASYNALRERVGSLLHQVQRSGIQLMSTSTEIAATAKQQERTVNDFGAATNQVVAAAKQISATSQELVRTMGEVSHSSGETADMAGDGRQNLTRMEDTMRDLTRATQAFADKLAVMNEHARGISAVVDTISKVADQTNLLSLNAAIEAEKAGEFGLGFSVVAREIRRLADQTAVATLDIERMVTRMQDSVTTGVQEMGRFSEKVSAGGEDIARISAQLERIIGEVQHLQPRFESVNEGMQAQSQGARQISQAMELLNETALQTAESLSEFNKATQQLKDAALTLQKETSFFRVEG